jgi:outer membrane protein OmpA-like peptidoglycan-associated protein
MTRVQHISLLCRYNDAIVCGIVALLLAYSPALSQQVGSEKENLGPSINSAYDEVYPLISPDGKTLYFVRKGHPGNVPDFNLPENSRLRYKDDIWFSVRDDNNRWSEAKNIGQPLNNENYNYVCGVLPDNNTLLLGNYYLPDGSMIQGVSLTQRDIDGWSFPRRLNFSRFSNKKQYSEFSISPHANILVMSIQPEDDYYSRSFGSRDLYVSFIEDSGLWSAPKNIGEQVNSVNDEITPYLASDGKTLYFSSNRPGGLGKNDVYMTRRLDDSWLNWTAPVNLGYPVNTSGWDAYFTVPGSENFGYVVSTTDTAANSATPGYGKSDIFRVKLASSISPSPVMIVFGKVRDIDGNVVPTTIIYERLKDNSPVGTAVVNPSTGDYKIALPSGENYGFRAEADGYYPVSENIDLSNLSGYEEIERNLTLMPIAKGVTVKLNNIFFDFATATLKDESIPELNRLVLFLKTNPSIRMELAGHTDSVGTDSFNTELSQKRAEAVVAFLLKEGIMAPRLVAKGYGESRPVSSNVSEEGRQKNRRVEFTIL